MINPNSVKLILNETRVTHAKIRIELKYFINNVLHERFSQIKDLKNIPFDNYFKLR